MEIKFSLIFILLIFPALVSSASFSNSAQTSFYNSQAQLYNPSFQDIYSGAEISSFWPQYSESSEIQCQDNNDFLVMIPPGGCSPAVVRSDLLSDQNVPVFCQLIGAKVNPLIKVSSIKSISFKGKYPEGIAGISFHPARAAVRSYNSVLGSPTINNLGYVVIILKKQANESAMAKFISGNLTASLAYDAQNAFGTGSGEYYLETVDESDWQQGRGQASFWQGRGLLRVVDVNGDKARIAVYTNEDKKLTEFNLRVGETSSLFYFPGFYCNAGIKVRLNSLVGEEDKALLNIDGDDVWVVKGQKILDGRCSVLSVNLVAGTTGSVDIRCSGSSKPIKLSLVNALSANIVADGASTETLNLFNVSNRVYTGKKSSDKTEYNWNLAYTGVSQISAGNLKVNDEFIVLLASEKGKEIDQNLYAKLNEAIKKTSSASDIANLENQLGRAIGIGGEKIRIIVKDSEVTDALKFSGLVNYGKEIGTGSKEVLSGDQIKLAKDYFDSADKSLQELLSTNPVARDAYSTYGEQGIISAMNLIDELSAKGIYDYDSKKIELANKFLELYPDSNQASYVRDQLTRTINYDSSNAFASVYVNNAYHTISVREFYSAPLQNRKTSFVLTPSSGGKSVSVSNAVEGTKIDLDSGKAFVEPASDSSTHPAYLVVRDIQPLSVSVDFYNWTRNDYRKDSYSFSFDSSGNRDTSRKIRINNNEYNVLITDVDVKEVAQVSLVSELKTHSEANFSFKIGIEQRSIKINPEKAKEVSSALNETIKKWENKNAALGKLVEKWKGVCLATGLGLQVKNLFGGFTGESLARQEVMKTYKSYCLSNESGSMSKSQCYSNLSDSIDKDIECYKNAISSVENNIKSQTLEQWKSANPNNAIPVVDGKTISTSDFTSFEDVKSYLLNQEIQRCGTNQLKKSVSGSTNNQLYTLYTIKNQNAEVATNADELPVLIKDSARVVTKTKEGYDIKNIQEIKASELKGIINNVSPIDFSSPTGKVLALLEGTGENKLGIATVKEASGTWKMIFAKQVKIGGAFVEAGVFGFTSDKNKITITEESKIEALRTSRITFSNSIGKNCNYQYKDPKVRFYDSGSNKGMPAVVPFDKEGWYVLVPQSSGGFLSDNVKGYTASGVPTYYYICSVGSNGIMELRGGDDSCFSNNINTDAGTYGDCALSAAKVQSMRSKAESAIKQAAQQYGKKSISISSFGSVGVDAPMTDDGNLPYECEDFMSVDDCKILYNVCDPVICPSSRCDFGGQTKVANVIQSGIVGSLLLCSKNSILFGGDVVVPFCLTGVHAGIEGYISILKAQRDCMAQAAATGQHVGICDEITAVYKCEFFWRQAAPLMQNLIPNVAEFLYTGGEKGFGRNQGGGEYATFQASWDNMQKSIDYFKNNYASTSFTAVKFGNVEEIGTEFCRSFVGTSLPSSGNALSQMLKPESPYQFYAQFSEIPFTEATVPATSQYKVFYHIYAGNDQGVSYQVYLKNPPSSSYYYNAERVSVKVGYIAAGGQVSETKDMTLPAGYKELCVIVNGREECGFKSVTTDYGLDTLSAAYTKDQAAKTDIKTEKECIQGSASVYGLVNLNPQAGVETATQPNVALNGIVRVCATENPGKGTNSARWKQVGTCGSDNLQCWLDETSVNNAVKQVYGATGTIASAEQAITKTVNTNDGTMTEEKTSSLLSEVRANVTGLKDINKKSSQSDIERIIKPTLESIDKLISFSYLDLQQAEAMLQKYLLYDKIVRLIIESKSSKDSGSSSLPVAPAASTSTSPTGSSVTLGGSTQDGDVTSYPVIIDKVVSDFVYLYNSNSQKHGLKKVSSSELIFIENNKIYKMGELSCKFIYPPARFVDCVSSTSCPAPTVVENQLQNIQTASDNYLGTMQKKTELIQSASEKGCALVSPDLVSPENIVGDSCTDEEETWTMTQQKQLLGLADGYLAVASNLNTQVAQTNSACLVEVFVPSNAASTSVPTASAPTISGEESLTNMHIKWDREFIENMLSQKKDVKSSFEKASVSEAVAQEAGRAIEKTLSSSFLTSNRVAVVDNVAKFTQNNTLIISVTEEIKFLEDFRNQYNSIPAEFDQKKAKYDTLHVILKDRYPKEIYW